MQRKSIVAALAALCFAAAPASAEDAARGDPARYRVETVAERFDRPWSVAVLPDGRLLVSELGGRLKLLAPDGAVGAIDTGALPGLYRGRRTGLMEVAVDPDFGRNAHVYLTYTYGEKAANNTRLVRAALSGDRLEDLRVLFSATPKAGDSHYGGRLAFLPDGTLILTLGDGFDRREDAQRPENHLGKLVRLTRDGAAPADNPLLAKPGAAPEIFSLGHRNVQGVAVDPADGSVLVAEHGPRGGDEINRVSPGRNYGWPVATGGLDYTFARVSPFRSLPGYEAPILEWTPSIAPSGLAVYDGELFEGWRGDLLIPALKERTVRRVRREQGQIVGEELLLAERGERIRDVRVALDGAILVLTDGPDARLLRIVPAEAKAGG